MKCASEVTSACEKCSSSVHFGMRAWIRAANFVASPRNSRCSSCGGRSDMARRLCRKLAVTSFPLVASLTAFPHRFRERGEQRRRIVPAEAGIGNALSKAQWFGIGKLLAAFDEVRLDHHADDAALAASELPADIARHLRLPAVVLPGVGMRAVDHQPLGQAGAGQ